MLPKIISLAIFITLLTACAGAQNPPLPAGEGTGVRETSTPTQPSSTETFTPAPTPEPTEAPYNYDVERAKQDVLIENAPNRVVDFEYLNSPEYFNWLKEENEKGNFPEISPDAAFVEPNDLNLRYEELEKNPSNVFIKYGSDLAFTFERSWRWKSNEKKPWAVVDAGVTEIGKSKVFFHVLKWRNSDGSEAFWGRLFMLKTGADITDMFLNYIDRDGVGYPTAAYIKSSDACSKAFSKNGIVNSNDLCALLGANPDSAVPKDVLQNWRETGVLTLNFLPWSAAGTNLLK